MGVAGDVDDPHVGAGQSCGFQDCGQQEFSEESMAHMVGSEVDLVALLCFRIGYAHDAGIVDKNVKMVVFGLEAFGGLLD